MSAFIHVNAQSSYSLLEGAIAIKDLIDLAVKDGQPALGLADRGNLFGALEFSETALKAGLQPLNGVRLPLLFEGSETYEWLSLIACSDEGRDCLIRLGSEAYLAGLAPSGSLINVPMLHGNSEGLICLAGAPEGVLFADLANNQKDRAHDRLTSLKGLFGDRLYLEIQRHDLDEERRVEPELIALAYAEAIPLVATQTPLFRNPEHHAAHDALICIAEGKLISDPDRRHFSNEHYFKSAKAMKSLFKDIPEALDSTCEIAQRCTTRIAERSPLLPRFDLQSDKTGSELLESEATELRRQAEQGLEAILEYLEIPEGYSADDYRKRLEFELSVIEKMEFPGYFLVVAEFIKWAKDQSIPVGPGRGSGAASVVAWSLGITGLDPIRFSLLFERFLNPERISMPDFDIDFCQDGRDRVIAHVRERYGDDRVAAIITFGSLQARAALRDVGRVLEMPYGQVDKLCKMVPSNPASPVTLAKAIESEPPIQEALQDETVARLFDYAGQLEGLYRHASTHAAGIVIGDRPLQQLVPLYRDPRSEMAVTQYNMKWVEKAGLVKFDFLGLRTLSIIRETERLIVMTGLKVDCEKIPLDDEPTFVMLRAGHTVGVFQVESAGMRRTLLDMQPTVFTDLVALVALFRPGPMQNIPSFCARKRGDEEIDYLHPLLESVLKETYGVIVYQEQVLQIAQILAGYSLGQADMLRRAMGKKIKHEMDEQRTLFSKGAQAKGIPDTEASRLFDLIARFADYGFNKAHSAAYALITYQTAWLKVKHPAELLAASMTYESHSTDRVRDLWLEARRMDIPVATPSINSSAAYFDVREGRIYYSLAALKGVGEAAAQHIAEVRGDKPFADLDDWISRIDGRQVNKRALEGLIAAGAFDCLGHDRALLFANVERITASQNRAEAARQSGQNDLFGGAMPGAPTLDFELQACDPWTQDEKLKREHGAVGFFISGHPLDDFNDFLMTLEVVPYAQLKDKARDSALTQGQLAASVIGLKERATRKGGRMGIVDLSDSSGQFEAVIFSESLAQYRSLMEVGSLVLIDAALESRDDELRLRLTRVRSLSDVASRNLVDGKLKITISDYHGLKHLSTLKNHLYQGNRCLVEIEIPLDETSDKLALFRLPGRYDINTDSLKNLRSCAGLRIELSS